MELDWMRFPSKGGLNKKKVREQHPDECSYLGLPDLEASAKRTEKWLEEEKK